MVEYYNNFILAHIAGQQKPEGEQRLVHNSIPLFPPSSPFIVHCDYTACLNEVSDAASRRMVACLFLRGCCFARFTFGLTFKRECCERMERFCG